MCYNYRILLLAEIINHCDNFIPEDSPQDVYQIIDFSAIIHTKIRFNEFKSNFKNVEDACNFSDSMIVSQRSLYVFNEDHHPLRIVLVGLFNLKPTVRFIVIGA